MYLLFFRSQFQSTHPVRGGTISNDRQENERGISIHPPREGWDEYGNRKPQRTDISIHPPREGWDISNQDGDFRVCISIHPPREGWDVPLTL